MTQGKKFDEGKIRYDLLPVDALREVARVLTFGAAKYGDNNWKITKPESRYTAAAFRHGEAYRGGEMMDKESGVHHLAHRICCDLFLLQIDMEELSETSAQIVDTAGNSQTLAQVLEDRAKRREIERNKDARQCTPMQSVTPEGIFTLQRKNPFNA
jgi:hypothetical protein